MDSSGLFGLFGVFGISAAGIDSFGYGVWVVCVVSDCTACFDLVFILIHNWF